MKHSLPKSIWAVFAGFLFIVVVSIAADTLLKLAGILPWDHLFVSTGLILFVLFYRAVFSLAGCYLTAKLAPSKPMNHAIILGVIGLSSVLLVQWLQPTLGLYGMDGPWQPYRFP